MLTATDLFEEHAPQWVDNIIVAVSQEQRIRWFITESCCWHFAENEVDETSRKDHLASLAEYEGTSAVLREYSQNVAELFEAAPDEAEEHVWAIFPSLFIDVENRSLWVLFEEYIFSHSFCNNAPKGWRSRIHSRLELIPAADRYWIIDGVDLIKKYLFDWTKQPLIWDSNNLP